MGTKKMETTADVRRRRFTDEFKEEAAQMLLDGRSAISMRGLLVNRQTRLMVVVRANTRPMLAKLIRSTRMAASVLFWPDRYAEHPLDRFHAFPPILGLETLRQSPDTQRTCGGSRFFTSPFPKRGMSQPLGRLHPRRG